MDCQDAKDLSVSAFDECKRYNRVNRESDVLAEQPPVSRESININIERADHVMIGNNNTIVHGEMKYACADVRSCDQALIKTETHERSITNTGRTSESAVSAETDVNESNCDLLQEDYDDTNKTDNFPGNLLIQQQQNIYSKRKKERGKIGQPPTTRIRYRDKNRKKRKNESETERLDFRSRTRCPALQLDIRAPFVQVVFLGNEKEDSPNKEHFSHMTTAEGRSPTNTLDINIEADFVQIGHDNEFLFIRSQTQGSKRQSAKFAKRLKKFDVVMEKLHKQRDSGDWKQFEEITTRLLAKYTHEKDIHISILLEQSVAANYQKDLEQAEKLAQGALSMVQQASQPMVNVFRGRAYYCLSCVYKRTQELEKAFEYIELSEESLSKTDSVQDKAFLAYEKGCVLQVSAGHSNDEATRQTQLQEAKQSFKQCLRMCLQMYEAGEKRFLNKHLFAMMKIAMLLLDCRTKATRCQRVSEENIDKAKKYLDKIESNQELWERIAYSKIARVQFELARADYFFRRASYRMAEERAQKAVELAIEGGFKTEVEPGLERLADIRERFESQASSVEQGVLPRVRKAIVLGRLGV